MTQIQQEQGIILRGPPWAWWYKPSHSGVKAGGLQFQDQPNQLTDTLPPCKIFKQS